MKLLWILGFLITLSLAQAEIKAIYEFPEWWIQRDFDPKPWLQNKCRDKRIIGGQEATANQFPYHVGLLLYIKNSSEVGLCGGALISTKNVLTAAHCVDIVAAIEAVLGAHSMIRVESTQIRRKIRENEFLIHEGYNPKNLLNDVALVKFTSSVPLNEVIQVVRMPEIDSQEDYVGAHAFVSGWGIYSSTASISKFLRYIDATVITNDECRKRFPTRIRNSTRESLLTRNL